MLFSHYYDINNALLYRILLPCSMNINALFYE